jgi:hypothetical protein
MTGQPAEPPPPGPGPCLQDGPEPEEPTDAELFGLWPDPFAGPPDDDGWSVPVRDADLDGGFAGGGPLDVLAPDEMLARFAAAAYDRGLGRLSDDELVGLLCASRRLASWQAAVELGVVGELDSRRAAAGRPGSSRLGEQVSAEVAAALTLTGRSADALLCLSRDLRRLPAVFAALFAGRIDRPKAAVFAEELAAVSGKVAAAIAMALREAAAGLTTGQLRAEIRAMVLMFEPGAVRRRAEKGRALARVETWQEGSGNWGIAGRELAAADVITADKRLTAIARALKDAGADGNLDQLRAAVLAALLTGRDPQTLAPPKPGRTQPEPGTPAPPAGGCTCGVAALTGSINLTMPAATWLGSSDAPGEAAGLGPADAGTCRDLARRLQAGPGTRWCVTLTDSGGRAAAHACARAGPDTFPVARASPAEPSAGPGEPPAAWGGWLASLRFEWLERGQCGHRRENKGYRPGRALRHLITIRQRTCAHPGCRRPAQDCDIDHTIPYQQGGRTCECNCSPFCRRHHRTKQAPGWHVRQPEPGTLIWTAPHGRSYTVHPARYPT